MHRLRKVAGVSTAQYTPGPKKFRKPSASVNRGLIAIQAEMQSSADVKASERDLDSRREAEDIRAALLYIDAAIAKATS